MSNPYDLRGILPEGVLDDLPAGTNVAIVGPSMTGKRQLALQLLAAGYEDGDGSLCLTTDSAAAIYEELEEHIDSLDRGRVGIIDTSGDDGRELLNATTERVSSPGDLTGISTGTAKLFQQFENRGVSGVRYGLISISTLLQYMDSDRVFKFLDVYTKRIEKTDGFGIYTLNGDSHDQRVVNTIVGQFDDVIELGETEAGDLEFRVRGFGKRPTPWTAL